MYVYGLRVLTTSRQDDATCREITHTILYRFVNITVQNASRSNKTEF